MNKIFAILFMLLTFSCFSSDMIEKDWTAIVYLNADNNLCHPYAHNDLKEMRTLDVSDKSNLIVVFDCSKNGDSKVLQMQGNKGDKILDLDLPSEFDMGDYQFLSSVSKKIYSKFPSKKRMLIMWNHGSGWDFTHQTLKGISYDDQSGNHITTVQMEHALKDISSEFKIDLLGYDACLMQMIEVAYQTHEYVDYVLASQYNEPGDGWDYRGLLTALNMRAMDPVLVSKTIIDFYIAYYGKETVQLSVIDSLKLSALIKELSIIAPLLADVPDIKKIAWETVIAYRSSKDLGDFLKRLPNELSEEPLKAYKDVVVYSIDNKGLTTGLAIDLGFFYNQSYSLLKFEQDTHFKYFLSKL